MKITRTELNVILSCVIVRENETRRDIKEHGKNDKTGKMLRNELATLGKLADKLERALKGS